MAPEYKPIPGFPSYLAGSDGSVLSHARREPRKLRLQTDKRGYVRVVIRTDGRTRCWLVHRLIAAAFLGAVDSDVEVHHRDGNPLNNAVENLQRVTPGEHAALHFRSSDNPKYRQRVIAPVDKLIAEWKRRFDEGEYIYWLATEYRVPYDTIVRAIYDEPFDGVVRCTLPPRVAA
jgi:hypothetical protein